MANPSMDSSPGAPQQVHRLEKNVLSVPNGIALAAAAMAPVIAVVLNAPAAGPVAGAALPLSFLLAFIACLLVGNSHAIYPQQDHSTHLIVMGLVRQQASSQVGSSG